MAVILEFNFGNFVDSRYIVDPIIDEDFKAPYRVLQRKTTECVCKIPMIQKNVVNAILAGKLSRDKHTWIPDKLVRRMKVCGF